MKPVTKKAFNVSLLKLSRNFTVEIKTRHEIIIAFIVHRILFKNWTLFFLVEALNKISFILSSPRKIFLIIASQLFD